MGRFPRLEGIQKAKDVDPEAYVRVLSPDRVAKLKIHAAQLLANKQAERNQVDDDVAELTTLKTEVDNL